MVRLVTLVKTEVPEEYITVPIIRVTRISELGTKLPVTRNRSTFNISSNSFQSLVIANFVPSTPIPVILMTDAMVFSETSVLIRAIQRNIPEDGILQSHRL
jgi:hypothetical protein